MVPKPDQAIIWHTKRTQCSPESTNVRLLAELIGEWLSLVEHLVRDQGVGGSNPLSPTNIFNSLQTGLVDPLVVAQVLWCERARLY